MVSWREFEQAAPELAGRVRRIFDTHKHKVIATLRADGAPRVSGIEVEFGDGELTFGSMPGARKGADLHRDPRFALHSATVDPPDGDPAAWGGDAKVAGQAVSTGDPAGDQAGEAFRADISEVVFTGLNPEATMLVVESWKPGIGVRRVERE